MESPVNACIFCDIVAGRAPASVIYEDDRISAFMTTNPTREGEFLVIPKQHIDHFCDLPDDLSAHLTTHAQRLSRNLRERMRPLRVGWVVHGFGVAHAHLIVVPQHDPSDIVSGRHVLVEDGRVRFDHAHLPTPPRAELDRMAKLLA
jgi:histidine triad (HIT) family protein